MDDITREIIKNRIDFEKENLDRQSKFIDRLEVDLSKAKQDRDNTIKIIEVLEKDLNK